MRGFVRQPILTAPIILRSSILEILQKLSKLTIPGCPLDERHVPVSSSERSPTHRADPMGLERRQQLKAIQITVVINLLLLGSVLYVEETVAADVVRALKPKRLVVIAHTTFCRFLLCACTSFTRIFFTFTFSVAIVIPHPARLMNVERPLDNGWPFDMGPTKFRLDNSGPSGLRSLEYSLARRDPAAMMTHC
jgi:hypothetical protein